MSESDDTFKPLDYKALLTLREGRRNVVYRDSRGFPTVGIGHLVVAKDGLHLGDKITDAQIDAFFMQDSADAMNHAMAQARQAGITAQWFMPYLASVCFQLGDNWTAKWPHTWGMICAGRYTEAADSLDGTPWSHQTPNRVADFQDALYNLPTKGSKS